MKSLYQLITQYNQGESLTASELQSIWNNRTMHTEHAEILFNCHDKWTGVIDILYKCHNGWDWIGYTLEEKSDYEAESMLLASELIKAQWRESRS